MEVDSRRRAFLGLPTVAVSRRPRVLIGSQCLNNNGVVCDACRDFCDVRAIVRAHSPGRVAGLSIDVALCTGCSECISVCPAKAITIEEIRT